MNRLLPRIIPPEGVIWTLIRPMLVLADADWKYRCS